MENVANVLFMAFGLIGGGSLISALILRRLNKMETKLEQQEQARVEESIAIITGMMAIGRLAEAVAIAQRDGKCNGEMTCAMKYYKEARDNLNDYLLRQAAARTHSRR